jgi:CHAD domain-containing protein
VTSRLPFDLLDRSAEESSRLLALHYLDQIDRAHRKLHDAHESEALHDFRVGLRRLRSCFRAYRAQLEDSVTGKMRDQLRALTQATNAGRDAEVQLDWLGKQSGRLEQEDIPAFFWLAGRLEDRKQETHDQATADVAKKYQKLSAKLRRALGVLRIELQTGQGQPPPTFREVTGALTRQHVGRLREDLGAIGDSSDADQIHRTRISLKRLRYLLEPIVRRNRRAGALVRLFREAQDLLGEHHDMHVLAGAIASLQSGVSGSSFSGLEQGLATLARLADEGAAAAFERFQSMWGDGLAGWILTRAEELGQSLEPPASPDDTVHPIEPEPNVTRPGPAQATTDGDNRDRGGASPERSQGTGMRGSGRPSHHAGLRRSFDG